MKKIKNIKNFPLLFAIVFSTVFLTLIGYIGKSTIYADYSVEALKTPQLAVVFQGMGEDKYPWDLQYYKMKDEDLDKDSSIILQASGDKENDVENRTDSSTNMENDTNNDKGKASSNTDIKTNYSKHNNDKTGIHDLNNNQFGTVENSNDIPYLDDYGWNINALLEYGPKYLYRNKEYTVFGHSGIKADDNYSNNRNSAKVNPENESDMGGNDENYHSNNSDNNMNSDKNNDVNHSDYPNGNNTNDINTNNDSKNDKQLNSTDIDELPVSTDSKEDSNIGKDSGINVTNTTVSSTQGKSSDNKNEKEKNDSMENPFIKVTKSYFDDALFIGDSRTVGLSEYSGWEKPTFYADEGLSIYQVFDKKIAKVGGKKVTLEDALKKKSFKKIYIMLGINELGTGTSKTFTKEYEEVLNRIRELQPNSIIFIEAIMNVTKQKSDTDPIFNNKNIKDRNNHIKKLADNKKIFYIDVNEDITDKTGGIPAKYTFDDIHLKAAYYKIWTKFLMNHGVEIE